MADETKLGVGEEPYLKVCQCSACEAIFKKDSGDIVKTAQVVVKHWNEDHSDILKQSYEPFEEVEQERHELETGVSQIRCQAQYVTVYDILAADDQESIFNPAFIRNVLHNEICEDCGESVEDLDGVDELGKHGPVTTYLCHECKKKRKIRRRKANNRQLSAFERV